MANTRQIPVPGATALRITLAGRVSISAGGHEIPEERLAGRQGRLLFAYLVIERCRPVPRDELAEVLWGASPPATWEKGLTVLVSRLRSALADSALSGAAVLTNALGCYRLDLPAEVWVDIEAAAMATRDAAVALEDGRLDEALAAGTAALEVLRRPLLPADDGTWVEAKRRELADIADEALASCVDADLAAGRLGEAIRLAEEAITHQPFRESGYRRLMQAHASAGNRAEALRVYDRCRRLLSEELGAYPSPETEATFRELLKEPEPEPHATVASQGLPPAAAPAAPPAPARSPVRRFGVSRRALAAAAAGLACALALAVVMTSRDGERKPIGPRTLAALDLSSGRTIVGAQAERGYDAIAAADSAVWAVDSANHAVVRLDAADGSVRDTIPVGADPSGVASAFGAVWVANTGDGTVSRVNAERGQVVQTVPVGNGPDTIAAGAGALWVVTRLDSAVVRIDPHSGRVRAKIPLPSAPTGLVVAERSIWVSGGTAGVVFRIDPATNSVADAISVGRGADHVGSAGGFVWVSNSGDHTVSRIDPRTSAVTATIPIGGAATALAGSIGRLWIAREKPAALLKIVPARAQIVRTITLAAPPQALADGGSRLWLATGAQQRQGGTLRILEHVDHPPDPAPDPALSYGLEGWGLMVNVYDGLLAYKRVGGTAGTTILPDLALSLPAVTNGGRTYRFELRRVRYADGTPLRASDVRHSFERVLRLQSPGAAYYAGIRGADRCSPRGCDLAHGIVTDDTRGTVVFHLTRPDPDFTAKLSLSFAWILPASVGTRPMGPRAAPGTGPYRIATYTPGKRIVLVRNPHFRVWAPEVQPRGNAERIEVEHVDTVTAALRRLSSFRPDVISIIPTQQEAERALVRNPARIRSVAAPNAGAVYMYMNTRVAPFDDVRVRRALNYAVDHARLAQLIGPPVLTQASCQVLPQGLPGYRPYCPYTRSPTDAGAWTGPDLVKARRLVAASERRGTSVTILALPPTAAAARELTSTLRLLGFPARTRVLPPDKFFPLANDPSQRVQASVSGWGADYLSASGFLFNLFDCRAFKPNSTDNTNFSEFCDPRTQAAMERAEGEPDSGAAGRLWAIADRRLTDAAPVVPLVTQRGMTILSPRVENFQYHPLWGVLVDQLSIR
jgi:peptide/nickel transport system substrate-binding protein